MAAVSYIIKSGDTLSGIALEFCGNAFLYPALAALNHIANPNLIYTGDTLTIDCDALNGWSATNPSGTPLLAMTSPAVSKPMSVPAPKAPTVDPNDPALSVGSTDAIDPSIPKYPGR